MVVVVVVVVMMMMMMIFEPHHRESLDCVCGTCGDIEIPENG